MPITAEELKVAVFKGGSKISPVRVGIGLEFFKVFWEDMAGDNENTVYLDAPGPATITASETKSHILHPE